MKRIYLFLSILLCALTMSAQSVWVFNSGDSISWQPIQDMTITYEKDLAGFFWQNIQTGTLDVVRMPINTGDGITFADTPFMQAEKNHIEVTNAEPRRFEVRLKTNITDWNSTTCQSEAEWLRLVDTNGSMFPVIVYTFEYDVNFSSTDRDTQITFKNEQYNLIETVSLLSKGEKNDLETERAALMELYYMTDGDNWTNNTNWGSDKPVGEWYGCETDSQGRIMYLGLYNNNLTGMIPETISGLSHLESFSLGCNHLSGNIPTSIGDIKTLYYLDLSWNELTGTIPESLFKMPSLYNIHLNDNKLSGSFPECLTRLMDNVEFYWHMDLRGNYFTGKIPDVIVNHPRFKDMWTNFLCQYTDLDLSNVVLYAPDFELVDIDGNIIKSSELYKNNKLTLLYNWESWCSFSNAFNENLIPAYNQFHEKGFEVLGLSTLCDWAIPCVDEAEYRTYLSEKSVPWHNVAQSHNLNPGEKSNNIPILYSCDSPNTVLVDQDGKIISQSLARNGGEDYIQIIPRLEEYFGESVKYDYYTSTDYSHDEEVLTLQTATEGNGIDLVFLGEAFTDKDMGSGEKYEQKMQEAVEQFFNEEPYASLRSRFNVYAVKVVSPNAEFGSGARHTINGSDEKAFEYAKKAVGGNVKRMMVGVVYNTDYAIDRSYTTMYEDDGSFVAYIRDGVSNVLNHEMGGHGIAFLFDEYVEPGMEDQSPSEEDKVVLDAVFANYGEGANVDWRSNPSDVKWAHFINDSRYANEKIGVYEGAWFRGRGVYRPTENSMMRYNDCGFNAPSREAIYKRVMKLSEGESWIYDYETFVSFDTPAREAYKQQNAARRVQRQEQNTSKKRIESRPPTIYKGTWRDAGKCEKVEFSTFTE